MTDNRIKRDERVVLGKLREAAEARDVLAAALTRAGIQLPAMDVRTQPGPPHDPRYALVQLGACSAPVALALAEVIVQGTSPGTARRVAPGNER